MATWQVEVDDIFNRPDTLVIPAEDSDSSPGFGPGNNWRDPKKIYQIVTDPVAGKQLLCNVIVVSEHWQQNLTRPTVENKVDQKVRLITGPNTEANDDFVVVCRYVDDDNMFYFRFRTGLGSFAIQQRLAGVDTTLTTQSYSPHKFTPGTDYTLEFEATTLAGVTTLKGTLKLTEDGTVLATKTITNTTAALQVASSCGIYSWYWTTPSNPNFSRLTTYYNATESMTVDPTALSTYLSVLLGQQTVNVVGTGTNWTPGSTNTFSILGGATIISQIVIDATHATVVIDPGSTPQSFILVASSGARAYLPVILPTISASPVLVKNTVNNTVLIEGFGTVWTEVEPTFSILSGGLGAAILDSVVDDDNHATLTMNAGSLAGELVIQDSTSEAITKLDVGSYLTPADSDLLTSPYNWRKNGSSWMQTIHPGAYIKAKFNGTAIYMNVDVSPLVNGGVSDSSFPTIRWKIDSLPARDLQLDSLSDTIVLATNLDPNVVHNIRITYLRCASGIDRWVTPVNVLRVTNLFANGEWETPERHTYNSIAYWDSNGQGFSIAPPVDNTLVHDATLTAIPIVERGLDTEIGAIVVNGQGQQKGGDGGVPALYGTDDAHRAYNKHDASTIRTVNGLLVPPVDYVFNLHGTNDGLVNASSASMTTSVLGFLEAARVMGPTAKIFEIINPGRYMEDAIVAAYESYQQLHSDAKTFLSDLGADIGAEVGQGNVVGGNSATIDGVHFRQPMHAQIAAAWIGIVLETNAGTGSIVEAIHLLQATDVVIEDYED